MLALAGHQALLIGGDLVELKRLQPTEGLAEFACQGLVVLTDSAGEGDGIHPPQAGGHGPNPGDQLVAKHSDRKPGSFPVAGFTTGGDGAHWCCLISVIMSVRVGC